MQYRLLIILKATHMSIGEMHYAIAFEGLGQIIEIQIEMLNLQLAKAYYETIHYYIYGPCGKWQPDEITIIATTMGIFAHQIANTRA